MFRARLSPIFIACDKMPGPRLPWNLRVVTTPRSPTMGLAKNTQHNTSEVLRLPHKMTKRRSPKCCACHEAATHLLKTVRKYYACHAKRFSTRSEICGNVTKCHACHAKRGYTTFETSKRNQLALGTAMLRTVADTKAASSERLSTPRPPK
jgi:hypothetical protein